MCWPILCSCALQRRTPCWLTRMPKLQGRALLRGKQGWVGAGALASAETAETALLWLQHICRPGCSPPLGSCRHCQQAFSPASASPTTPPCCRGGDDSGDEGGPGEAAAAAEEEEEEEPQAFSPERGNVAFGSAYDGWAFRIDQFAEMYAGVWQGEAYFLGQQGQQGVPLLTELPVERQPMRQSTFPVWCQCASLTRSAVVSVTPSLPPSLSVQPRWGARLPRCSGRCGGIMLTSLRPSASCASRLASRAA